MEKLLIIDNNDASLDLLTLILSKEGYDISLLKTTTTAIDNIIEEKPNLILLNIHTDKIDGLNLCAEIKNNEKINDIPIIFISAISNAEVVETGYAVGATDFITKPYKPQEIKIKIANHLKIAKLQKQLEEQNKNLAEKVTKQVKKISDTQMETIFSLAKLAQSRDDDTGKHLERVQQYCATLTKTLAKNPVYKDIIDKNFEKNIINASPLHDIGKVGITDLILLKPSKLTPEEFEEMKKHTLIGSDTLNEVHAKFGDNAFIEMGKLIARSHHERWDGNGYPDKLKGEEIPLSARIMSVADVYDALSTKRVYKDAFSQEKCVSIIKENIGTQFDPHVGNAFLQCADELYEIRQNLQD